MRSVKRLEWSFSDVNLFKRSLFENTRKLAAMPSDRPDVVREPDPKTGKFPDWVLEQEVSIFMMKVGITPKYAGFAYLRTGICFVLRSGKLQPMTTKVYPFVAKAHEVTPGSVERDIRHALKVAFESQKLSALNAIVGEGCVSDTQPMTNGEFVATVSEFFFWQLKNIENYA